jgi:8-oxo-dGTP pyrophosphatase MutT (NUDIX family)
MNIDPNHLKKILSEQPEKSGKPCPPIPGIPGNAAQPAAVLMPLVQEGGVWNLIFIKRTVQVNDSHSGQIAFPGGRVEKSDLSYESAALRESHEELGIHPSDVDILGKACPILTVTDYEIHPFPGILPWPYRMILSEEEVVKTILIPLQWLADPKNRQIKSWRSRSQPGMDYPVIFYDEYEGEILWGATAQIVSDFLNLIQSTA